MAWRANLVPASGSSPRVRGTDCGQRTRACNKRFIPARAGNSRDRWKRRRHRPVHPRACGEQQIRTGVSALPRGSSPRVRGTGRGRRYAWRDLRFIPARAGNRSATPTVRKRRPVHPRACGEQLAEGEVCIYTNGSSPRVRGTAVRHGGRCREQRFIPARAGNRHFVLPWSRRKSVHPRACGEQRAIQGRMATQPGSSPRVRGTVALDERHLAHLRFIPARAGNRFSSARKRVATAVHPRACGEQLSDAGLAIEGDGSSPRVRGTGPDDGAAPAPHRFIPARAGNSISLDKTVTQATVHPRACGEQSCTWPCPFHLFHRASQRRLGSPARTSF